MQLTRKVWIIYLYICLACWILEHGKIVSFVFPNVRSLVIMVGLGDKQSFIVSKGRICTVVCSHCLLLLVGVHKSKH